MGKGTNYVSEKMRVADDLASRSSGVSRSEEERAAENKAWKEAFAAQKQSEATGAGRGGQGGPTAEQAAQRKAPMSSAERAVREEQDFDKWSKVRPEQKYAKGGSASKRADGIASRGKTRGTIVAMCGGGRMKK